MNRPLKPKEQTANKAARGLRRVQKTTCRNHEPKIQRYKDKRAELEQNLDYVHDIIRKGSQKAEQEVAETLKQVKELIRLYI
ncbi:MAG: hypothetical protein MZV64_26785 [Ignavibacteriales bacterium]|nr:hypothetical protein [Ignavibacteriales bacterium]